MYQDNGRPLQKIRRILHIAVLSLSLFVYCFPPPAASAQGLTDSENPLRLEVSPLITNLTTTPGTAVTATFTVTNQHQIPEAVQLNIRKLSGYTDEGLPVLAGRESGDDYLDWITLSENRLVLDAKESKTVTATIRTPQEASFGYYYAITFVRDADNEGTESADTTPVTLILLEANVPNAKREIELVDFSVDQGVYEYLPVHFQIQVRNTGNVHTLPIGTVVITSATMGEPITLLVNPASDSVLPSTSRVFSINWKEGFPVYVDKTTNGKAARELAWDFNQLKKLRFGKYDVSLLLTYHDGTRDQVIERTTSFWVIPWRISAVVALLGALMLAGAHSIIRSTIAPRRSK